MEGSDQHKRVRKIISYAEQAEEDDDFLDFKPLSRVSSQEKRDDKLNITDNSTGEKRKTDKENQQNYKEKRHDRESDRGNEKGKKDKKKDREKHRKDRDKDRHSSRDKDRLSSRDKDRHSSRDKDRERSSKRDESRREKQDRSSEKHKHARDSDKKHSNSEKAKREGSSDYRSETSDSPRSCASPQTPSTSSQDTPRRKNAKVRLTLEEKVFQRELEAALAISRIETNGEVVPAEEKGSTTPRKQDEVVGIHETQKSPTERKSPKSQPTGQESYSPSIASIPLASSVSPCIPKANELGDLSVRKDVSNFQSVQDLSNGNDVNSSASYDNPVNSLTTRTEVASEKEVLGVVKLTNIINPGKGGVQPQPSTSGLAGKRPRKAVVFKEDSDSDSFTGFSPEDSDCDLSEGSDFEPSPKKKKKKKLREIKNGKKSKAPKTVVAPSISSSKTTGKKQDHKISKSSPVSVKENTAPSSSAMHVGSPSNTPSLKPATAPKKRSSSPVQTPPKSAKGNSHLPKIAASISNTTSPSSRGGGRGAIGVGGSVGLVKTPFKSPVLLSPSQANNSTVLSRSAPLSVPRSTGLRLGLSRRANVKPLHPSIATKLSD